MPTFSNALSPQQLRKLRSSLERTKNKPAVSRMYSLLADEAIRRGISNNRLREVLRSETTDSGLLAIIENDLQWLMTVKKADSFVALLKTTDGQRALMTSAAAYGVSRLVTGERATVAEGLGGQGRAMSSEMKRWITAAAIVEILRSNAETETIITGKVKPAPKRAAIISNQKFAAELGVHKDAVGKALDWAAETGILVRGDKWRGGGRRWTIGSMTADEKSIVMRTHGTVVTSLLAMLLPPTDESTTTTKRSSVKTERMLAELRDEPASDNPYANMFLSVWQPVGVMKNLSPLVAPHVAANILRTAKSVLWNSMVSGGLSPRLWLLMLAGTMGVSSAVVGLELSAAAERRAAAQLRAVFGKDWIERLNDGEDLNELVFISETDAALAKQAERYEQWEAKSIENKERRVVWEMKKDISEGLLNDLFRDVGAIPDRSKPTAEKDAWIARARTRAMKLDIAGTSPDAVAKQLARRFEKKGYSPAKSVKAAEYVVGLPMQSMVG